MNKAKRFSTHRLIQPLNNIIHRKPIRCTYLTVGAGAGAGAGAAAAEARRCDDTTDMLILGIPFNFFFCLTSDQSSHFGNLLDGTAFINVAVFINELYQETIDTIDVSTARTGLQTCQFLQM
jgi:hypothetical protein